MGMFYDFARVNREEWKFTYTGAALLNPAKVKLIEVSIKETANRKEMARLMEDKTVPTVGEKVQECRKQIEYFGKLKEQLGVLVHEFARVPTREYHLALGDVTFLDLHQHVYDEQDPVWQEKCDPDD